MNDIAWFHPDGAEMNDEDWNNGFSQSVTVYLKREIALKAKGYKGEDIVDDCFLLLFNAYEKNLEFWIPLRNAHAPWLQVLDTHSGCMNEEGCETRNDGNKLMLEGSSMVVLRRPQKK